MRNQRLLERKLELKELTLKGRAYRQENGSGDTPYTEIARFKHIAYCMAKGTPYEEIELKTHRHNKISEYQWETINKDRGYLQGGFDEDVYLSA